MRIIFSLSVLLLITSCANTAEVFSVKSQSERSTPPPIYVIKNVNIIPMTESNVVIENATVVIEGNKIVSINKALPTNSQIIDGTGKWLIPGLIDMHIHGVADIDFRSQKPTEGANLFFDTQDMMTPYIANGVTTIFDLEARADNFGQRNEIIKGWAIGPRIALAKLLNGGKGVGHVNTASDGRQAVRSAKADGYEFIKVYSQLNIETFWAIVDEAQKQNLKVLGHIPSDFHGRLKDAFVPNFSMVAHAGEFSKRTNTYTDEDAMRFAIMAKENGIWVTPTLTEAVWSQRQSRSLDEIRELSTLKYMHPIFQDKWLNANNKYGKSSHYIKENDQFVDFNNRLVKAFKEVGVPIVAGSDAMGSGVVPGFSLHDELELLVQAGLSPAEALTSSTRLPAIWLGMEEKIGTVEIGKYADLILLDSNPLNEINNIRNISGVFVNGRWLDRSTIKSMLSNLAKKNSESLGEFKWKDRRTY